MEKKVFSLKDKESIFIAKDLLEKNELICFPTDTIYGLLGLKNKYVLQKLYLIRRPSKRPFITLSPSIKTIKESGFEITPLEEKLLSIEGLTVLLRDKENNRHAFRVPKKGYIRDLLDILNKELYAPSCNKEGQKESYSIEEGMNYFSDSIYYFDAGYIKKEPSTLCEIEGNRLIIYREGIVKKEFLESFFNKEKLEVIYVSKD